MKDLLIIVPSIRVGRLEGLYNGIKQAMGNYTFDLFIIGPESPTSELLMKDNVTFFKSFGSPTRCVQEAACHSSDAYRYITWTTDDAVYNDGALAELLAKMKSDNSDMGIVKYTEDGPPNSITGADDDYYIAYTHDDLRKLPGIKPEWWIAPVGIYRLDMFIALGGLDCRYEHINMSTHDLAFRIQDHPWFAGLSISPNVVMHCNSNSHDNDHKALDIAHHQNDYPIFQSEYSDKNKKIKHIIPLNNFVDAPEKWRRFDG